MRRLDRVTKKELGKKRIREGLNNNQIMERLAPISRDALRDWRKEVALEDEKEKQKETEMGFVNKFKSMNVRF